MTQAQNWVSQLDDGQKIRIIEREDNGAATGRYVEAALPEEFGFSVGSEIGTPFAGYATEGRLAQFLALSGVSTKAGLVTTKIYQGPEPTEMELSLSFDAYYSAKDEVVGPIVQLMLMAVGSEDGLGPTMKSVSNYLKSSLPSIASNYAMSMFDVSDDLSDEVSDSRIDELLRFFRAPNVCQIEVGNLFTIERAYISTVTPSFSNVLDSEFMPMHATCTVSVQLEKPFHKRSLARAFS